MIRVAAVASTVAFVLNFVPQGLYFNPLWNCGGLLLVCLMAITQTRWTFLGRRLTIGLAGVGLLAAAWAVGTLPAAGAAPAVLALIGSAALIAHLTAGGVLASSFARRPLLHVGTISYELHLWHYPLRIVADALFPGSRLVRIAFVLVLTIGASELSHRLITAPLTAWAKPRLEQAFAARQPGGGGTVVP